MESPFETLERHDDHAHSDLNSHEKPVLPKRTQNLDPLLKTASRDSMEDSKFQISAATSSGFDRFFSSADWGRISFPWPRRTKSRWSKWHVLNQSLLSDVWNSHPRPWCCLAPRCATMIPTLSGVFSTATMQHNPIPTSTQISDDLARTCWLHNTPRVINWTWRNAIRDSNRLRQHCQARFFV